jgi:hypothetical protein
MHIAIGSMLNNCQSIIGLEENEQFYISASQKIWIWRHNLLLSKYNYLLDYQHINVKKFNFELFKFNFELWKLEL